MTGKVLKVLCAALIVCLVGCGGQPRPRSLAEIEAERETLPALFMTASGKRLTKPSNTGAFVDPASREIAWPAYTCDNPACPGHKPDGEPVLFIWADPSFFVTPEGTLGSREFTTLEEWNAAVKEAGSQPLPSCPECLKKRNVARETPEQTEQYLQFVHQYELPETTKRRAELDAEWATRQRP